MKIINACRKDTHAALIGKNKATNLFHTHNVSLEIKVGASPESPTLDSKRFLERNLKYGEKK